MYTPEQIEEGNRRLLLAARATLETKFRQQFTMEVFGIEVVEGETLCGTPACVLGNYAVRTDLQDLCRLIAWKTRHLITYVSLVKGTEVKLDPSDNYPVRLDCDAPEIQDHFAITQSEACLLFAYDGCNKAATPEEAATYIEDFVARRRAPVVQPNEPSFDDGQPI